MPVENGRPYGYINCLYQFAIYHTVHYQFLGAKRKTTCHSAGPIVL